MKNKIGNFKITGNGNVIFKDHPKGKFLLRINQESSVPNLTYLSGIDPASINQDVYTLFKIESNRVSEEDFKQQIEHLSKYYGNNLVAESDSGIISSNFMRMHDLLIDLKSKSEINVIKYRRK